MTFVSCTVVCQNVVILIDGSASLSTLVTGKNKRLEPGRTSAHVDGCCISDIPQLCYAVPKNCRADQRSTSCPIELREIKLPVALVLYSEFKNFNLDLTIASLIQSIASLDPFFCSFIDLKTSV